MRHELRAKWCGMAAWAAAMVLQATVSAAEPGPTAVIRLREPARLLEAISRSAPTDDSLARVRAELGPDLNGPGATRPAVGWCAFDEEQSFRFAVAWPAADPKKRLAHLVDLLGLRPTETAGEYRAPFGVVVARDGQVLWVDDPARLKDFEDVAALLPADLPEADVAARVRPRAVPGFLRRLAIAGMVEDRQRTVEHLRRQDEADRTGKRARTASDADNQRDFRFMYAGNYYALEVSRQLLMDTERLQTQVSFKNGAWELEGLLEPTANNPVAAAYAAEQAAPSRFTSWEADRPLISLRESCLGGRGKVLDALRDECARFRATLAQVVPPEDEAPPPADVIAFLKWVEQSFEVGNRDWALSLRDEGGKLTIRAGLADAACRELGPILRRMFASLHRRWGTDTCDFRPAAWNEGEFVVDVLSPRRFEGEAAQGFRDVFGDRAELALACGPDRVLILLGNDCRGLVSRAIRETAAPEATRESFRATVEAGPGLRFLLALPTYDPNRDSNRHATELLSLLQAHAKSLEKSPSHGELRLYNEGGTRRLSVRVGAGTVRALGLLFELGEARVVAQRKAAAAFERGR